MREYPLFFHYEEKSMTKKIALISIVFVSMYLFIACQKGNIFKITNSTAEVSETGATHDITDKNNSVIFVKPGDIVKIVFFHDSNSPSQWNFRDPIQGNYLTLKDHFIIKENDSRLKKGQYISEWRMKILKTGEFPIRFHKEDPLQQNDLEGVYAVKIISGKNPKQVPYIIIDTPQANDTVVKTIKLIGYAKSADGKIFYRLKNQKWDITGDTHTTHKAPRYGYFEEKIDVKPFMTEGILEVFLIDEKTNAQTNLVLIPLKFQ